MSNETINNVPKAFLEDYCNRLANSGDGVHWNASPDVNRLREVQVLIHGSEVGVLSSIHKGVIIGEPYDFDPKKLQDKITDMLTAPPRFAQVDALKGVLFHMVNPDNVWNPDRYAHRPIAEPVDGKEFFGLYQYVRGSGYFDGVCDGLFLRIYFSNLQGFQIYVNADRNLLEQTPPKTFHQTSVDEVYNFILQK